MTSEICGITPDYWTLRQKISAYPATDTTPSWIRAPPESLIPITSHPNFAATSITFTIFSAKTSERLAREELALIVLPVDGPVGGVVQRLLAESVEPLELRPGGVLGRRHARSLRLHARRLHPIRLHPIRVHRAGLHVHHPHPGALRRV